MESKGPQEKDQEVITIIGKEEDTKRALGELKAIIEELMAVDQINFDVDQKYHRHFVARRGQILKVGRTCNRQPMRHSNALGDSRCVPKRNE